MKLCVLLWFVLFLSTGCNNENNDNVTNEGEALPTFDSTTIEASDTVPQLLHLDNPLQDSTPITLDAPGNTILPEDTNYRKKRN